jgi:hypothetical protein
MWERLLPVIYLSTLSIAFHLKMKEEDETKPMPPLVLPALPPCMIILLEMMKVITSTNTHLFTQINGNI